MKLRFASRVIPVLAVAAGQFVSPSVATSQLPWEYYKRRGLAEVISQQRDVVLRTFTEEIGQRVFLGGSSFPSLPNIEYLDSDRATSARRLELIGLWVKTYEIPDEAPEDYTRELLFREDGLELWLPVRKAVIEELERVAAAGRPLTLYVVWVGALRARADIEWVFLVYGFQQEGTSNGQTKEAPQTRHREELPTPAVHRQVEATGGLSRG